MSHTFLEKVFQVVLEEAKSNPEFAQKIEAAVSTAVGRTAPQKTKQKSKASRTSSAAKKTKTTRFDATEYHAVVILRSYDEGVLRGRLNTLTKEKLRKVASFSGLVLTGISAKKTATKEEIIEGIVAAAKQYIAQRGIAAA